MFDNNKLGTELTAMTHHPAKHLNELPNRYNFIEIINQISKKETRFSLMLIDIMRFSDVSTAFGHSAGDDLLLQIVNQISKVMSSSIALGRISGDIFGLIFTNAISESALRELHTNLCNHFKTPLTICGSAFIADFNVGAAVRKNPKTNINTIISLAETALKKSKSNRHENFTFLTDDTREHTGRGLTLKADLQRAITNNEFELFIQPKVDLDNFSIIGGECLLRWNHPLDGLIFPGTLLRAAESYNMMNDLGYWTLEESIKTTSIINKHGFETVISVNVSPTQLYDPYLVQTLKSLLNKYKVCPTHIELELTEDVALTNSLLVKQQLAQIKEMGVAISMDDFGKGYSNLSFIRDLDLSAIKIDKAFVLGLEDSPVNSAIVQATKVICDAKGCKTYAEGIETLSQLELLKKMGIEKGQGFLFSRAVPLNEFLQQLTVGNFSHVLLPNIESQIAS